MNELKLALDKTSRRDIAEWGARSGGRLSSATTNRVAGLADSLKNLSVGALSEISDAIGSTVKGELSGYLDKSMSRLTLLTDDIICSVDGTISRIVLMSKQNPEDAALTLFASVVGFYSGGGTGDGGIPDLDLTIGGIGWHRSIFTHSIIAGIVVEASVLSILDLVETVHHNLPEQHAEFWDELQKHSRTGSESFVTGASLGIASHLGIDTFIDGFTPYKDLPISLPMEVHQALMGLNAGAEGLHAADRIFNLHFAHQENSRENQLNKEKPMNETMKNKKHEYSKNAEWQQEYTSLESHEQFEWLGKRAIEVAQDTKNSSQALENSIENGERMLLAAQENFRLGVIGEFRVGKSTLINALIGQEVAFTDIIEATSTECVFRYGDDHRATIIQKDGSTRTIPIDDMNDLLDDGREDKEWLRKIDHVAYSVNSVRLKDFDIWDAPGIGGSDDNERLANRFLEKLGGAIWVIDIGLIGKASIDRPLSHLKQTGKPVIGVLNRIDEYEGDIDEAIKFVHETYPGLFSTILPMSAVEALDEILDGGASASVESLWSIVLSTFGMDQSQGAETRLKKTLEAVNGELSGHIAALRRSVLDQIGLCEHVRYNLDNEKKRILLNFPTMVKQQADRVFGKLETDIWKFLDSRNVSSESRADGIDEVIKRLKQKETYDVLMDEVREGVTQEISEKWRRSTDEAINLSKTALAVSPYVSVEGVNRTSESNQSPGKELDLENISPEALDEGYFFGGISAVVAGSLAAVSASISWPVVLAALPIGALAAWKKQRELDRSGSGIGGEINRILDGVKSELLSRHSSEFEMHLNEAFDEGIDNVMSRMIPKEVGVDNLEILEDGMRRLEFLGLQLGRETLEEGEMVAEELLKRLSHSGAHLDIVITDIVTPLGPLLSRVSTDTRVRLILLTSQRSDALSDVVTNCFDNWQGQKKARAVICNSALLPVNVRGMLISAEFAVQTSSSLANLSDQYVTFEPFGEGRLAAQRIFALLWDGKTPASEPVEIERLH